MNILSVFLLNFHKCNTPMKQTSRSKNRIAPIFQKSPNIPFWALQLPEKSNHYLEAIYLTLRNKFIPVINFIICYFWTNEIKFLKDHMLYIFSHSKNYLLNIHFSSTLLLYCHSTAPVWQSPSSACAHCLPCLHLHKDYCTIPEKSMHPFICCHKIVVSSL